MNRPANWPDSKPWPPHPITPPEAEGEIHIVGQLRKDAELRVSAGGGHGVLIFDLHTGKGYPYEVHQPIPAGPDHLQAATTLQHALRRGVSVRVSAHGCIPRMDHGLAVLQLLEVTHVTPI